MYAILKAIENIEDKFNQNYILYTDSLSSLKTLQKVHPKNHLAQTIQEKITVIEQNNTHIQFVWIPSHKNIKGNEAADTAAKQATTDRAPTTARIQTNDVIMMIKDKINSYYFGTWDIENNNKLRSIKSNNKIWISGTNRKTQVITNRLRIGHSRLTHAYLFQKEEPPYCETCKARVTIKHIITECKTYRSPREQHKIPPTLKEALDDNNYNKTIQFLTDINLINQI